MPGFRKGRVPRQVLLQRVGSERLMPRRSRATSAAGSGTRPRARRVRPVAQPEYDFELPAPRTRMEFTATVAVQAKPELPDWTSSRSASPRSRSPRSSSSTSSTRCGRRLPSSFRSRAARRADDTVVVDLVAEDETRRDYVVDLGRGAVVEEVEQGLVGMSAGRHEGDVVRARRRVDAALTATVKEIKEKVLPPLDDDSPARPASSRPSTSCGPRSSRGCASRSRRSRDAVPLRRGRRARRRVEGRRLRAARRGAHARAAARPRPPGRGARHRSTRISR